jgi:hypothetical protein
MPKAKFNALSHYNKPRVITTAVEEGLTQALFQQLPKRKWRTLPHVHF